jgi:hypothetical protein
MAATPMIGDVELKAVQWVRQETDQGFARQRVPGLDGTVHQRLGRRSHRIVLAGLLLADTSADDLKALQEKARSGEEITFTADIATALEIQHMVIESFVAEQVVGRVGQYAYIIALAESPALPPPAEVGGFGGLDEFGLGELGFDADLGAAGGLLDGIASQAGELTGALDTALDAVDQLEGLAALADLADVGNPLQPLTQTVDKFAGVGPRITGVLDRLDKLIG